jgi:GAF domain-containing protein
MKQNELEVLVHISQILSSTLDLNVILSEVARLSANAISATSAYVCGIDFNEQTTTVLSEYFSPEASKKEIISDLGTTYSLEADFPSLHQWVLNPNDKYISQVDDPNLDPYERVEMELYGAKSILSVPLHAQGEAFGYIELWESRCKREFTQQEIQFVQSISNQVAMAIHNAQLHEELIKREHHYREIFNYSPVSLWKLDLSQVKKTLNIAVGLEADNIVAKFCDDPDLVTKCRNQIIVSDVNKMTCEIYEAHDKNQLIGSSKSHLLLNTDNLYNILIHLVKGNVEYTVEFWHGSKPQKVRVTLSVPILTG